MDWEQRIEAVKADFSTSDWLKRTLDELMRRDPVDAANDARLLSELMEARCEDLLRAHGGAVAGAAPAPQPAAPADNVDEALCVGTQSAPVALDGTRIETELVRRLLARAWLIDVKWHRDRHEIRRIVLDLRDTVTMAPSHVESRAALVLEFLATARGAQFPGGSADGAQADERPAGRECDSRQ